MEDRNKIFVDDLKFNRSVGSPFEFDAKFSDKKLAGIELNFHVPDEEMAELVKNIFHRKTVKIGDPFIGREYKGQGFIKSTSYRNHDPETHFIAEVKELDLPPQVTKIQLNDYVFEVLKYTEKIDKQSRISRSAILKLSEDQLLETTQLVKLSEENGTIAVKRIDVDNEPVNMILVVNWWSKHREEEVTYYKRYISMHLPSDESNEDEDEDLLGFGYIATVFGTSIRAIDRLLASLYMQNQSLLNLLISKGVLTQEEASELAPINWEAIDQLDDETRRIFSRVSDAEDLWLP